MKKRTQKVALRPSGVLLVLQNAFCSVFFFSCFSFSVLCVFSFFSMYPILFHFCMFIFFPFFPLPGAFESQPFASGSLLPTPHQPSDWSLRVDYQGTDVGRRMSSTNRGNRVPCSCRVVRDVSCVQSCGREMCFCCWCVYRIRVFAADALAAAPAAAPPLPRSFFSFNTVGNIFVFTLVLQVF